MAMTEPTGTGSTEATTDEELTGEALDMVSDGWDDVKGNDPNLTI
jgi:hypothetical protein